MCVCVCVCVFVCVCVCVSDKLDWGGDWAKLVKEQHWSASYEAGSSVVMFSFTCHSPIILAKRE